jgi:peptidoglycan hydrolase CwlO-like protein
MIDTDKEDLKKKIEHANKVITDICSDISELKADYRVWKDYMNKLEQKLHGYEMPPEPKRKIRERETE